MSQNIPLINVSEQNKVLRKEIDAALANVIDNSAFILGQEVNKFEEEFKAYTEVKHAISCASGTDALLLPLMSMEVGPGDEVLVPSFTFYATAGSVARLGAKPIFVDSDATYNMDLEDLARKITPKTKAIIPVHLFGQMVDMEKLQSIVRAASKPGKKIFILEDAAQSMGAAFKGKQTGLWGDYAAYSFYPTKNLGAMGDAGMMAALDDDGNDRLRMIRVHGSKQRYYHELIGVNSRLDSMQAAILRIKLRHLKSYEAARTQHAKTYYASFASAGLGEKVQMPVDGKDRYNVWNQFTIRAQKRDQLRTYLSEQGIGSEIYYPLPMHEQKAFAQFGCKKGDLPFCEKLEQEVLSLPMFPELKKEQAERVVAAIFDFYKKH